MDKLGPRVRVQAAVPRRGFKVLFTFDNGVQREIDLEPYLHGPIFEPLRRDPKRFRAIKIEGGAVAWDNGAGIDPDVLYYNLEPARREEAETTKA